MTNEECEAIQKALRDVIEQHIEPVFERALSLLDAALSQNVELRSRIAQFERAAKS